MEVFLDVEPLNIQKVLDIIFDRSRISKLKLTKKTRERVRKSNFEFVNWYEKELPIYGVTTGFGESSNKWISLDKSRELQDNLVSYLLCGTGKVFPEIISRAVLFLRIHSLSRGYSGVSEELLDSMLQLFEMKYFPVIPQQGSLGASGDLIPLAYLANNIRGEGRVYHNGEISKIENVVEKKQYTPYDFKPKEGLSIVNGTSAMTALGLVNLNNAKMLLDLCTLCSGWLCLVIEGREEAFGELVNNRSKSFVGQAEIAERIRLVLSEESYSSLGYEKIKNTESGITSNQIQDPYSLRCVPQILGPILDTITTCEKWLCTELNGVSDNPLIDQDGVLANGGNFYGGYISHSMDYLKICVGHMADMVDRQLMLLINDKTNRGLPANLVNVNKIPEEDRSLHHGLKGVHQNVSAITSEVMSKSVPNGIFSRSSESHNQDKVSLGMTAAVQCFEQIESMYNIMSCYLLCLVQALDLKDRTLSGKISTPIYEKIRDIVGPISFDQPLDEKINKIKEELTLLSHQKGKIYDSKIEVGE